MSIPSFPWSNKARRGRASRFPRRIYRPELEVLERRILFSATTLATALPLTFNAFETAQAAHFLSDPREAAIYQVHLGTGDQVNAAVSALTAGSGLASLLRVFDG